MHVPRSIRTYYTSAFAHSRTHVLRTCSHQYAHLITRARKTSHTHKQACTKDTLQTYTQDTKCKHIHTHTIQPSIQTKHKRRLIHTYTQDTNINSNKTHTRMHIQDIDLGSHVGKLPTHDIITVPGADGTSRRVAILGLLTHDPGLYRYACMYISLRACMYDCVHAYTQYECEQTR
jgi:hypothetical protein